MTAMLLLWHSRHWMVYKFVLLASETSADPSDYRPIGQLVVYARSDGMADE